MVIKLRREVVIIFLLLIITSSALIIPNSLYSPTTAPQEASLLNNQRNGRYPTIRPEPQTVKMPRELTLRGLRYTLTFREPMFRQSSIINGYWIPIVPHTVYSIKPGYPLLPVNISIIELPYNARVLSVNIENVETNFLRISYKVLPSPQPLLIFNTSISLREVFVPATNNFEKYPSDFIEYRVFSGLDPFTLERKKFLVIYFYPMIYLGSNMIIYVKSAEIKISYGMSTRFRAMSETNLSAVIITSEALYSEALMLARLKNSSGISAIVRTVEWIYSRYDGRDEQEKIRNFIKDAVEKYGIKFVIIFGDSEHVPARDVWVPDGAYDYDPEIDGSTVTTDLYYADLDYTWDDNNDGLWGDPAHDRIDGVPDVIVGRIPVSNETEALAYLKKLATYKPLSDWFDTVLLIGTDTFMTGWPEGEYLSEYIAQFIPENISVTKLYETAGNLTLSYLIHTLNEGFGYINYGGHGDVDSWIIGLSSIYSMDNALNQLNGWRLPVIFSMACLTARFGDRDSIGEAFVLNPRGGAIGYVGATRLAWGFIGEMVINGLAGEMSWRFSKNFFSNLTTSLGQVWAATISEYIENHPPTRSYFGYYLDWKTVTEFVLLGDPTISIVPIRRPNATELTSLEATNAKVLIEDSLLRANWVYLRNATLEISDATLVISKDLSAEENSHLVINNSNLYIAESIRIYDSSVIIRDSVIDAPIELYGDAILELVNSYVARVIMHSATIRITAINSSIQAAFSMTHDAEISVNEGLIAYMNFSSTLGYAFAANNSYLLIVLNISEASVNITSSILSAIYISDAETRIEGSKIGKIIIKNSSIVDIENSDVGVEIFLENVSGELELRRGRIGFLNLTDANITGFDSVLSIENSLITAWHLVISASKDLEVTDSEVCVLNINNSSIIIGNSNVSWINLANSRLIMEESVVYYFRGANSTSALSDSHVTYLSLVNSDLIVNNMVCRDIKLWNSSAEMNNVETYHTIITGEARVTMINAIDVLLEIFDETILELRDSRLGIVFAWNSSSIYLYNTSISYAIRIQNRVTLYAESSSIWPELVFRNENITIIGLVAGYLEYLELNNTWSIIIRNSVVIGWDVISYNSQISVINSQIYWFFGYSSSLISVEKSYIGLLRVTHKSTCRAELSFITEVVVSGSSIAEILKSTVNSVLALGNASIKLALVKSSQVIAFMNSSIDVERSIIDALAPFDYSRVHAMNSIVGLWLELYDVRGVGFELKAGHYASLTEEDIGVENVSWELLIENSDVTWYLITVNSSVTITNSQLMIFAAMDSNVTIGYSLVVDILQLIGSRFEMFRVTGTNYTLIVNSLGTIMNCSFANLEIWNSRIIINNSRFVLTLFFSSGDLELTLRPSYYGKAILNYTTPSESIVLDITSSWVINWMVLAIGNANVSLVNSSLMTIGAAEKASINVRDSIVYGYLEVFPEAHAFVENSLIGRLYLVVEGESISLEVPSRNISVLELNASSYLFMRNTYLYSIYLEATLSSIRISNTPLIGEAKLVLSNLIADSIIAEKLSATNTELEVLDSRINSLRLRASAATIENSSISFLTIDYFSATIARNSRIGLNMVFRNTEVRVENLIGGQNFVNESINGGIWSIRLENTIVTNYSVTLRGFSNATITNSELKRVSCHEFSTAKISLSKVTVIAPREVALVDVYQSIVGLDLLFRNTFASISVPYNESLMVIRAHSVISYTVTLRDSKVLRMNVTAITSEIDISESDVYVLFASHASSISLDSSSIILALLEASSNLLASDSEIRLLVLSQFNTVELKHSSVGITLLLMGRKERLRLPSGAYPSIILLDNATGWIVKLLDSEIIDWRIIAIQGSEVIVENSHVLLAYAEALSRIKLINCLIELPPIVDMLGRVEIYWTLRVITLRDLVPARGINVTIFDENGRLIAHALTNEEGVAEFLLTQAIITEEMRIDLGTYIIQVGHGFLRVTRKIYLWKTMEIRIYLIGPITILISAVTAALLVIIIKTVLKVLREKKVRPPQVFP